MKKLMTILFVLGFAVSVVGCTMMSQSGHTHSAIENEVCDVHKVIVKKENGVKTVTVVVTEEVTDEQKAQIDEITKQQVPDANQVEIKLYKGKK